MSYLHIDNLYKSQDILLFRECYAMEKIHGTSAHVAHKDGSLRFFSGGSSHDPFVALFDQPNLIEKLIGINVTIYGESYGGKCQGMSSTYGKQLRFIAFDVKIAGLWLSVPDADQFCKEAGIEFVHYNKVPTDLAALDAERDADSVQAIRNGMGAGHEREGIVLRPLIELTKNNGARIITKHKREKFKETKGPRPVDVSKLKVLSDAQAIADEWVTPMRLVHILDKIDSPGMEKIPEIIQAMFADIEREGVGEIEWSAEAKRAVGRATAIGVKNWLKAKLAEAASKIS